MLTDYWTQLRYHPVQSELWQYEGRYAAVVAGRGSGKTEVSRRKTVLSLPVKKPWGNPIYAYCLPTFAQAKRVAWDPLINLIPKEWLAKEPNISNMEIKTIFGSTLFVVGMDKPQRLEGIQIDGCVVDESSDQKPDIMRSLAPAMTHRSPWCWRIGVPKRTGVGRVDFRLFFEKGIRGEGGIKSFYWKSSEILTDEQIAEHKEVLSEDDFNEQFNALWLDAGGTIYYAYSRENISEDAQYDPSKKLLVGCDFNVDPMCWVIAHFYEEEKKLVIFDELFLRNTNTEKSLDFIWEKYQNHSAGFAFFGDASSHQRKTSTAKTDYMFIKNDVRFPEKTVHFPRKNPKLKDRFSHVNANLKNANGERHILINPRCKHLIQDMEMMSYKEGTTDPEDYTGTDIGHTADALGYLVQYIMPLRLISTSAPEVILV